jgi:hypothetical protein
MRRDDECEKVMKGNNGGEWSFDGVVLWLGRKRDGDAIEWWGE